jgi:perosamine synthetase
MRAAASPAEPAAVASMDKNSSLRCAAARACPRPGLSPWDTLSASMGRKRFEPESWFGNRKVLLTQSGRTAVALLRDACGLNPNDEVLMSAYNCGTEVDALLSSGLKVRFVDCDEDSFVTRAALNSALTSQTRAIYIIHPFGWPQPLPEIDKWRTSKGLLMIEDCALTLFGTYPDGAAIGSRGDASIYSIGKILPCPDGGALSWISSWPGLTLHRALTFPTMRGVASRNWAWLQRQFVLRPQSSEATLVKRHKVANDSPIISDMPKGYYFDQWRARRAASGITKRLLNKYPPLETKIRRRRNYELLSMLLRNRGIELLFSTLPEGVCPHSCPIRTEERERLLAALSASHIDSSPWWKDGHPLISWSNFPMARKLKRTILPLPVHQQLGTHDMHFIADVISNHV